MSQLLASLNVIVQPVVGWLGRDNGFVMRMQTNNEFITSHFLAVESLLNRID